MYVVLVLIGAIFGAGIAIHQLDLQAHPATAPSCAAGIEMLFSSMTHRYITFKDFLTQVLAGSSDCAAVPWTFLKLSMAGWALVWFVVLGLWALVPRRRAATLGGIRPVRPLGG